MVSTNCKERACAVLAAVVISSIAPIVLGSNDTSSCGAESGDATSVSSVTVTDAHRGKYRDDGFVVFDDFLNADQLDLWRRTVDEAVSGRGDSKFAKGSDMEDCTNEDFDYYDRVFTQRINLHMDSDELRAFLVDGPAGREIGRIARELTGHDAGFRLWHNQALYKEPYANPTSWHLDVPYWSFDSPRAISAWIALDDADEVNGCLHFLPGSHLLMMEVDDPYEEVKIGKNMDSFFRDARPGLLSELEPVSVPMRAGSISFHSGLTVHAAGPNMTPRRRRAMTYQLMPIGDNVFNGKRNVLGREYYDSLKVGDTLDDDTVNPPLSKEA